MGLVPVEDVEEDVEVLRLVAVPVADPEVDLAPEVVDSALEAEAAADLAAVSTVVVSAAAEAEAEEAVVVSKGIMSSQCEKYRKGMKREFARVRVGAVEKAVAD